MGNTIQPDADSIRSSAQWHFHDFDPQAGTASLLQLEEYAYRSASFLDQRAEPLASARAQLSLAELESALTAPADGDGHFQTAHFIFHHGHCGSTLLSRALAAGGKVLPLREPMTLRRLAADPGLGGLLEVTITAHSRTFGSDQLAMVKATSTCNSLIRPILNACKHARAILMYVPLECFLAGMLGKQSPGLDLKGHAPSRLSDWNRIEKAPPLQLQQLGEPQLAVLAWLTCVNLMLAAVVDFPGRARMFNFEEWLDQPESGLQDCTQFFGIDSESQSVLSAWPDISTGYSKKPDEPYSAFNRRRTLQRGRHLRGEDIHNALAWARQLVEQTPELEKTRDLFGA